MAIQYCAWEKTPVRSQKRSAATVPSTERTAMAVYSGIAEGSPTDPPEHGPHGLVGEKAADRDDDEEDELLERHPERQEDAGRVRLAVRPVVPDDPHDVPDHEDRHHRNECRQQLNRPAVHPCPQDELQRQGDGKASRHEEEVLVAVVHEPPHAAWASGPRAAAGGRSARAPAGQPLGSGPRATSRGTCAAHQGETLRVPPRTLALKSVHGTHAAPSTSAGSGSRVESSVQPTNTGHRSYSTRPFIAAR